MAKPSLPPAQISFFPPPAPADGAGIDALAIDRDYRNTNNWSDPKDEFNKVFRFYGKGINNAAGFRPKSKALGTTDITGCAFCVLVTNFNEGEWPDVLDKETGQFVYFGDNRARGKLLHDTSVGGNRLLRHVFDLTHTGDRAKVPPFLCFESIRLKSGMAMRFLGLACPGATGISAADDLVAVWRISGEQRFQNYRSVFTILKEGTISRQWLKDLVDGAAPADSACCPLSWKHWVQSGIYRPLACVRNRVPRAAKDQQPATEQQKRIIKRILNDLTPREFEFAAADIVSKLDKRFGRPNVTRAVRDGGRDAIGTYRVGHALHQVDLTVAVEAKQWSPTTAVGVKPMMRLISRLKHRDLGVFVTTSFFDRQVQQELIDDNHPVLLISGGDIAKILEGAETGGNLKLSEWIKGVKAATN